ncbi:hypothetical protein F4679DRAFT_225180 [Xylaria curta]|nr:hypothetical protein F4679DRAFT_225180 [Xylaria curta]
MIGEPPRTKNKPHRVTKLARRANKARQSHNCRSRQKGVLPASTMFSNPECPIHDQPTTKIVAKRARRHHDNAPNSQAQRPRTHIFVHGVPPDQREMKQKPQRQAPSGWTELILLQRGRSQAGQEGRMRKHCWSYRKTECEKVDVSRCASMAARFRCRLWRLSPKEERKEPSGDFLPKLYLRDDGKSEVSVCSFDSDLLDEGVEGGKEEKRV